LGLAIVAAIVAAHQGRVELRTAAGAGAEFRVILPVRPAATMVSVDSELIELTAVPVGARSRA
jgi:nitrogen-specific signal transduction histidine kinase